MNYEKEINDIKKYIFSTTSEDNYKYQICEHVWMEIREGNLLKHICVECNHSYYKVSFVNEKNTKGDARKRFEKKLTPELLKEFRAL